MDDPLDQPSRAGTTGWSVSSVESQPTAKKVTRRRRKASGSGSASTAKKKRATSKSNRRRATSKRKPETKPKPRAASGTKLKKKTAARRRAASESKPKKKTTRRRTTAKPKTTTSRRRTSTRPKKTTSRRRPRAKGGLADLIAEILARKSSGESSPVLGPILENLAKGLGLSSDASQAVVAFVLQKLLAGRAAAQGRGPEPASLLERMQSGQAVDKQYVISSGMAQELAEQSGLEPDVAAASLSEVLGQLRGTGLIP